MEWKPNHVLQVVTQGQVGPVTQLTLQVEIEARVLIRTDRLRQDQPFDSEGSFEVQPLSL
ncbi:hypothetical protein C1930_14290 [Stenotrophomonas sp. SAU14A_NAIMI4_8]|nr:hypothetical protein C1930_14290 [Stenotrophomonas sp. SAU14A_NAIMI4_8]